MQMRGVNQPNEKSDIANSVQQQPSKSMVEETWIEAKKVSKGRKAFSNIKSFIDWNALN